MSKEHKCRFIEKPTHTTKNGTSQESLNKNQRFQKDAEKQTYRTLVRLLVVRSFTDCTFNLYLSPGFQKDLKYITGP